MRWSPSIEIAKIVWIRFVAWGSRRRSANTFAIDEAIENALSMAIISLIRIFEEILEKSFGIIKAVFTVSSAEVEVKWVGLIIIPLFISVR